MKWSRMQLANIFNLNNINADLYLKKILMKLKKGEI